MVVDQVKQRKKKQRKANKKESMTKIPITFHQKSSSRSRGVWGGLGASLCSKLRCLGRPGGFLGAFGTKNLKKRQKPDLFGCFWSVSGGILPPRWAPRGHLGCILGVLGSIFGAFGSIVEAFFWLLVAWAAFQKTLKNLRFL